MGIRARRRPHVDEMDPLKVDFATARRLEANRAWPSWRDRWKFWNGRPDVPAHCRDIAEPDPRRVLLADDAERDRYAAERAEWEAGRVAFLEAAGGPHGR